MNRNTINQATQIARHALVACDTTIGFVAGTHHFVDLWARDSLFATFGANVHGMAKRSKVTITSFLSGQRKDGLVPYLILRSRMTIGKYFHHHSYYKMPVAHYRSNQSGGTVTDGGLMAVIAMRQYVETTKDIKFLREQYATLEKALSWYWKKFHVGLVREWFLCEWADAVLKVGNTLYTNTLYWKALGDMAWMAQKLGKKTDVNVYAAWQSKIYILLQKKFWNGVFFADWIDYARHDYIATHANMMAIVFGLASKDQAASILSYAKEHCWNGWTLESNYPKYEWWRIPLLQRVAGMADYHNRGCMWLQPGIWYAVALRTVGKKKEAKDVLEALSKKIIEAGDVYEVFEKNGKPVGRLLYRSEGPFAWTAGIFLWAQDILNLS
jgi:glycogen debranching enzyme